MIVKIDHFPNFRGENSKNAWNNHLAPFFLLGPKKPIYHLSNTASSSTSLLFPTSPSLVCPQRAGFLHEKPTMATRGFWGGFFYGLKQIEKIHRNIWDKIPLRYLESCKIPKVIIRDCDLHFCWWYCQTFHLKTMAFPGWPTRFQKKESSCLLGCPRKLGSKVRISGL